MNDREKALDALGELTSMAYRDASEPSIQIKEWHDTIRQALQPAPVDVDVLIDELVDVMQNTHDYEVTDRCYATVIADHLINKGCLK